MVFDLVTYRESDKPGPYEKWYRKLKPSYRAKIDASLRTIASGNLSTVKWDGEIGWVRLDWGPGLRIYLHRDGETLILLLLGGTKNRQQNDIQHARDLVEAYKREKRNASR